MQLDSRLRNELRLMAATGPAAVDPGTREQVVRRAATVRRQRRVTFAVSAASVLVVAGLVAAVGAPRSGVPAQPGGSPASSTRPTLSEAPVATSSFTSPTYGYTVSYPKGWTVTRATTAWTNGKNGLGDPGVSDIFQSPGKPRVLVAAQQIPSGWTTARWEADFMPNPVPSQQAACFPSPKDWAPVTVAGHPGGLLGRVSWCGFTEGVVLIGGRAYVIRGEPAPGSLTADTFDMGVLTTMFESMTPS